jgi:threonine dehydrogenase-like Zn-dependent dehydrogenase
VVHASGHPNGLDTALGLAGDEATVLEVSWYGDTPVTASLGGAFHSRRLRLVSSQVGRIAPSHRPRWTHGRRLAAALALLADARLDALLAPAVAFHDLARRLPDILAAGKGMLCQRITYR